MIRRVTKVEYATGQFLELPLYEAEQETDQGVNDAWAPMTGAHYEYDLLGSGPGTKANAIERLSFLLVGDDGADLNGKVDELRRRLFAGGSLKVWTAGDEYDEHGEPFETERWAQARIQSMPQIRVRRTDRRAVPVTVILTRSTDWASEDPISPDPIILPGGFTITNPGTAPIYDAVFTLEGSYTNPVINNTTTGHRLQQARSSSQALRWDAGRPAVERNTGSWVNDYGAFVRQLGQVHLMRIDPGVNSFSVSGVSAGTLQIDAYAKYH